MSSSIKHGKAATDAVQPSGRFGALDLDPAGKVTSLYEKPHGDGAWVNGGFFVLDPSVLRHIEGDSTVFDHQPLEKIAKNGQLIAYKHAGFWKCMDTLRDKSELENHWKNRTAPWKVWGDK